MGQSNTLVRDPAHYPDNQTAFGGIELKLRTIILAGALGLNLVHTEAFASYGVYKAAKSMIGLREGTRRANRAMGLNTQRIPWCGAFARKAVLRAGKRAPRHYLSARAWRKWGRRVSRRNVRRGDILNIRTRYGWHVSIFSHRKGSRYCSIGGNQRNRSKISCYRAGSVRGVRR